MNRLNSIFRNAMFVEIVLEVFGIFKDWPALAEVAVVALATTAILWQVFLREERRRGRSKCNSR